jgi:hypothetical protein
MEKVFLSCFLIFMEMSFASASDSFSLTVSEYPVKSESTCVIESNHVSDVMEQMYDLSAPYVASGGPFEEMPVAMDTALENVKSLIEINTFRFKAYEICEKKILSRDHDGVDINAMTSMKEQG